MCFRPAAVSMKTCPQCGAVNRPIDKVCAQCDAPLDNTVKDFDADQAALDGAIKAPAAPGAPKAPGAPVAPGAPKPPVA
ncbi:MAG: hypothetical protein Q4C41_05020 [Eggerthellaceae bacterium]|nr:hypothetical protein [Eggerthellaceae bacterium]